MFSYLLPASFLAWVSETVKARVERWAAITDRQMAHLEAELSARELFSGVTIPVQAIEATPANRIENTNGHRPKAKR